MSKGPPDQSPASPAATREERLAAKLRENLRRRKAQARALSDGGEASRADDCPATGPGESSADG